MRTGSGPHGEYSSAVTPSAAIRLPDGIDAPWLQAGIATNEAGTLLRGAVDASLKAGIFGSPTVVVDGEPFWGVEKFGLLQEWLESGGW